jgi:cysteine desulfurase
LKTIYLDHNATTLMEQGAQSSLLLYSSTRTSADPNFGNPSSIHWAGRRVKSVVDDAREDIARAFGVDDADGLFFTASATEATNTALKGAFFSALKNKKPFYLVTSQVEHEATLDTAHFCEELGATVVRLPVGSEGALDMAALEAALASAPADAVCLLSLIVANNETGVVFPWEEATRLAKARNFLVHLDAVQAPGKLPGFALKSAPADFASFSAHKVGGPKGVGALYARRGVKIESLLHGGAQERKRRAGTVNVAGIASFGAAARVLPERNLEAIRALRDHLESSVKERITGVSVQGAGSVRVVNTSNLLFDGVRGEGLLMGLDLEGFAVSSGSACNSGSILPSHVLLAMGIDKLAAQSAVRVSLGPHNTLEEIDAFVAALERVVGRIRAKSTRAAVH